MKHLLILTTILLTAISMNAQTKVYKGTSSYSGDVIATIRDGKVYTGNSSYSGDISFTIDGYVTINDFVAIWHAVKYYY